MFFYNWWFSSENEGEGKISWVWRRLGGLSASSSPAGPTVHNHQTTTISPQHVPPGHEWTWKGAASTFFWKATYHWVPIWMSLATMGKTGRVLNRWHPGGRRLSPKKADTTMPWIQIHTNCAVAGICLETKGARLSWTNCWYHPWRSFAKIHTHTHVMIIYIKYMCSKIEIIQNWTPEFPSNNVAYRFLPWFD